MEQVIPLLKNGQPTGEWAVVVPKDAINFEILWFLSSTLFYDTDEKESNAVSLFGSSVYKIVSILTPSTATPEQKELLAENGMLLENPYKEPHEPKSRTMGRMCKYIHNRSKWLDANSKLVEKVVIIKEV